MDNNYYKNISVLLEEGKELCATRIVGRNALQQTFALSISFYNSILRNNYQVLHAWILLSFLFRGIAPSRPRS